MFLLPTKKNNICDQSLNICKYCKFPFWDYSFVEIKNNSKNELCYDCSYYYSKKKSKSNKKSNLKTKTKAKTKKNNCLIELDSD
jgi:hypothetical protein